MIMVDFIMRQITPTSMPLLLFKPLIDPSVLIAAKALIVE
jgi:hypothetical protein